MVDRDKYLTIRASEDEVRMARALAEQEGISVSDLLRIYIRRAFAETFAPPKRKPKK